MNEQSKELTEFARDILNGLRSEPKRLSSKYFYNPLGDLLFQKIMELDEYYLTRSEFEILDRQKSEILTAFLGEDESFRLVELGAGDGTKTKVLLEYFTAQGIPYAYTPIDISEHVLDQLKDKLIRQIPSLRIEPIPGDYFDALGELKRNHDLKEVVLFLGSTIGNFDFEGGVQFLKRLSDELSSGDLLFIGFDLKKDPEVILNAYNDKEGITADFNLNLLDRINDELEANFDRSAFKHYPTYDPISGESKSYLISKVDQVVYLKGIDEIIEFEANEPIFMEVSQKYSPKMIDDLAERTGFKPVGKFFDQRYFFVDVLWEKF